MDISLISKFNKGFCFLLSVIDIYSKYKWVVSLKDKKGIKITMSFKNVYMSLISNQTKYG